MKTAATAEAEVSIDTLVAGNIRWSMVDRQKTSLMHVLVTVDV